jgi:hypothetical protein
MQRKERQERQRIGLLPWAGSASKGAGWGGCTPPAATGAAAASAGTMAMSKLPGAKVL